MKCYDVSRLPSMIELGFDGENNWRPNSFDCSALLKNHPDGVISLWLLPQGESQAFPVALERDGNTVVWTPLSEEMTAEHGALQIVCTDGTDVGKSAVVMFRVSESILPGAEHPAAVPSWATQTIERAESAADRAEEAAESIDIEALEARIAQAVEDYLEEHPVEAPVQSVNGKTGAVVLNASDVGALPADTPIPAAVTEQTVAGWGFTKNTGTYSKPSGGIPASDLAAGVIPVVPQMADDYVLEGMGDWTAGKTVDAATLKNAMNVISQGIASKADASDIPTAVSDLTNDSGFQTAAQVGAAISSATASKADKTLRVAMTSTDTVATIEPNKLYVFPEMASLEITLAAIADNTIANEYHFIFESGATATTLTIPATVNQPDGFTVEANMIYEVSILENCMTAQGWAVTA